MKKLATTTFLKKKVEQNKILKPILVTFTLFIFISIITFSQVAKAETMSWTNSGSNIYLTSNGNVGIGITNPTTKLDSLGTIRSKGTSNGIANYISQSWNNNYSFGITTLDSNQLFIGRMNSGGGIYDDLIVGSGVSSKASSNGASTFVNISNDGTTRFGEAVVNGPSSGLGTYYFGATTGSGNGIFRTYIKVDNNSGSMCLGNC